MTHNGNNNTPGSLFHRVNTRLTVDILPSKFSNIDAGMHEHLNGLLLRYNFDLNGVVLAYCNERILSHTALVHPYFPLARIVVSATLTLFRPELGSRLVGVVNKLSNDFISVIVLGFINVVIRAPGIRKDLQYKISSNSWISTKDPSHTISVGDTVAFDAGELNYEGSFMTIVGSLKSKDTGNICAKNVVTAPRAAEETVKKQKRKKKDKDGMNSGKGRVDDVCDEEEEVPKNSKRQKRGGMEEEVQKSVEKKKEKKKKKEEKKK